MKRVICVGSGLAAINFSLELSTEIELILMMADGPELSNSYLAKGGIAVSLDIQDQQQHIADTLAAGGHLCDPTIVEEVISHSPEVLQKLKKRGLYFDDKPGQEGGHSIARIQHISDQTGKFLVEKLWKDLQKRANTQLMFHTVVTRLALEEDGCAGVICTHTESGETKTIYADAIVLATGGSGNLFRQSTNGAGANGEGCGLALEAGVKLTHMEFMQFHPTKMYLPQSNQNVLVTEAFRGAGAVLKDSMGAEFMLPLHPLGSLAPRDIVSLGIYMKMEEEQRPFVWLDFSEMIPGYFIEHFPYLYQEVNKAGYFKQGKIPVTPAAHYQCGGIEVDEYGRTSMPSLYAIGEVAGTGLHGANRLASNSLLELFYFGGKLARFLQNHIKSGRRGEAKLPLMETGASDILQQDMLQLKEIMWHGFGILREEKNMQHGLRQIVALQNQLKQLPARNLQVQRLSNSLSTAASIASSACKRSHSLGCHQMKDVLLVH